MLSSEHASEATADQATGEETPAEPISQPTAAAQPAPNPLKDADLNHKQDLINKLKQAVDAKDWRGGSSLLHPTMNEWKSIHTWHIPEEDQLWSAFQELRHTIYVECGKECKAAEAAKEKICQEARTLANSQNWKETSERFHQLMDEWKAVGTVGREANERLWADFNGSRQKFFAARSAHFEKINQEHERAKEKKEELIKEIQNLPVPNDSWKTQQWREQSNKIHDLMTQWRAAGQANREDNDKLWEAFNASRQAFFEAQHAHFERLDQVYENNAKAKRKLIETAKTISATMDFSPQNTQTMRDLDIQWKQIGFAGAHTDNELWEAFRDAKEKFWIEKKAYFEERNKIRKERSEAAIDRRKDQIAHLQQQIDHLNAQMNDDTISEDYLVNMRTWIQEKQDRINELNDQIADITKKLS